jgi:hypothetical protein
MTDDPARVTDLIITSVARAVAGAGAGNLWTVDVGEERANI